MGNITDQEQHSKDVYSLRIVSELIPAYKRHLSHHLRNPLAGIMTSCELAEKDMDAGNIEALRNHVTRILNAVRHIEQDLIEVEL